MLLMQLLPLLLLVLRSAPSMSKGQRLTRKKEAKSSSSIVHTSIKASDDNYRQAKAPPPPLPGKKGVGLTMRPIGRAGSWVDHLPRLIALDPYWSYSWNYERIAAHPPYIEFIPMLWGPRNVAERMAEVLADQRTHRVLGFNEPDHPKQSNITVDRAVSEWTDNMVPSFQHNINNHAVSLISPSPAHPAGPWMQSFMSRVENVDTMDWIAVHWYDEPNVALFQRQMTQYYQLYGYRPLLITEFAVADWPATSLDNHRYTPDQVLEFMQTVLPWLEATPWIAGYAWFSFPTTSIPGTSSALFDGNGTLTPLGDFYASVRTERPQGWLV